MIRKKISIFSDDKVRINVRKGISVVCAITILIVGMYFFNQLLIKKNSLKKYEPFFVGEQEYDVLFFGSSHVQMGVSVLDLFHDYGITGYNLAVEGNFMLSNYYKMKVVLEHLVKEKRQLPKVIVMDIFDDKQHASHLHSAWDSYPQSPDKWKMTNRLVPEEERYPMMMPFLLYHSRWNELTEDDFKPYINRTFGTSNGGYGVGKADREDVLKASDRAEVDGDMAACVRQMKEMCDKLDIQLIFIHIPYSYKPEIQRKANGIYQYAEENGILCVDYMNEDIGIDFDIDFYDEGHLNRAGMRIVTDEIGRLLSGGGWIEDHRGQPQSGKWEQFYQEYIQFKSAELTKLSDAKTYLMSLNDPELLSTVQVSKHLLKDLQIHKLVERLKEGGNQIVLRDGPFAVMAEDGHEWEYDIYCEVYQRDECKVLIHKTGFICEELVYNEAYEK